MTLSELKKKYEANGTYIQLGPVNNWNEIPFFDGIVPIEYTYDDWLNDYGNSVFKNLLSPHNMMEQWRNIPTELSFYVKHESSDFDPNLYMMPPVSISLKIDCMVTITKEVDTQIKARQQQYIEQQVKRVLRLLKERYEKERPRKEWWISFIKHCLFEHEFDNSTKPILLFLETYDFFLIGQDNDYIKPDFDTVRKAYKNIYPYIDIHEKYIGCKWVTSNLLEDDTNEATIVALAYELFLEYLELMVVTDTTIRNKQEKLYQAIISACQRLQSDSHYWNVHEDIRNTQIRHLLDSSGYRVCDQSKHGESSTGKSSGELDGLIKEPGNPDRPFSIFEGVNLKAGKIKEHIEKLEYKYDTWGLDFKYLLVYKDSDTPKTNKFDEKWLENHLFHYPKVGIVEQIPIENSNLKIYKTTHNNDGKRLYLYHLVIEIRSKRT